LLEDPSAAWEKPVLMSHGPGNFAVRKGPFRLIRYADGSEELYDVETDPGEFENLALDSAYADRLEQLRKHLPEEWLYVMGPRFQEFSDSFAKPGEQARGN